MGVTPAVSAQFQCSTDQFCRESEGSSIGCPGKAGNRTAHRRGQTQKIFLRKPVMLVCLYASIPHSTKTELSNIFLVLIMTNPVGYLVPMFEPFLFCLVVYRACKGHTMDGFLSYQDGWRGLYVV